MKRLLALLIVLAGLSGAARAADVGPVVFRLGNGSLASVFVTPANVVYGTATFRLGNGALVLEPVIGQIVPGVYLWASVAAGIDGIASAVFLFGNGTTIAASFGPGLATLGYSPSAPLYEDPGPWSIVGARSAAEDDAAGEVLRRLRGGLAQ